jgi:hypothetical protein
VLIVDSDKEYNCQVYDVVFESGTWKSGAVPSKRRSGLTCAGNRHGIHRGDKMKTLLLWSITLFAAVSAFAQILFPDDFVLIKSGPFL